MWQMPKVTNLIQRPSKELWGLDIMDMFPIVIRQLKFLMVGIDYFTKWVEAEALATITEKNVRSFV